jgi:hypothetical protein
MERVGPSRNSKNLMERVGPMPRVCEPSTASCIEADECSPHPNIPQ